MTGDGIAIIEMGIEPGTELYLAASVGQKSGRGDQV
jgi:hypothetical protein